MAAEVDGIVTVTFAAGTVLPNSTILPISIQSDAILEGDESFTVSVVEVIDVAEDFIVVDSNVDPLTLTITDDEGKLAHGMEVKPLFLSLSLLNILLALWYSTKFFLYFPQLIIPKSRFPT